MCYQRSFEQKLRVGAVGVGSHCYRNILPTLTYLPIELVAIADPRVDVAEKTTRQYGARAAYSSALKMYESEELDAVILAVSARQHPVLSLEAFACGLHVWMEKPPAVSVVDIDEMIRARGDLIAVVGYKKIFMPATVKALELMAMDAMQPLRTISGLYPVGLPPAGASVDGPTSLQTQWLDNGCHPVSLLLTLAGHAAAISVHYGPEGSGFLVIRHRNGAVSSLQLATGGPTFQPIERYIVLGGRGSVEIVNTRKVIYQRGIDFDYGTGTSFANPGVGSGAVVWEAQDSFNTLENKAVVTQGLYGSLKHFTDCVLNHAPVERGSLEFAREVTGIYEDALKAQTVNLK
ncbi:MAG TPA: Gfo/Idh/MocA family oxidoreductase [Acidimicrobiales bacterium]|nr:Gfo/Idh/MocA family oxidoreductase [Acidimicrobiales bacterium]